MHTLDLDALRTAPGPRTADIIRSVLAAWPEHGKYLGVSFNDRSDELLQTTEVIADLLARTAADEGKSLDAFAEDYRYLCEQIVYPEELFFRREGRYRLSTFSEAAREVYDNAPLMARYMSGLFVSNALWLNHASAMNDFSKVYLPGAKVGGRHLEIGPGHGMLLHLAMSFGAFAELNAWDVSAVSIQQVKRILSLLGRESRVNLQLKDLYSPDVAHENAAGFDTIVLSEVLEHLERPGEALEIIRDLLAPGGTVWINVPANGPAPDHLFLLQSPQEAVDCVAAAGLEIERWAAFPVAGSSLERAIRQKLPISCVIVGRKRGPRAAEGE
jgi:2-polyprenyl-3-methyl-5-hydroxy-6-metoxy-1,4-benzoquinol methylase